VLDIDRVRDQVSLFDRLAAPAAEVQIVDVATQAFRKFFDLMRESDYVAEARARNVETDFRSFAHRLESGERRGRKESQHSRE